MKTFIRNIRSWVVAFAAIVAASCSDLLDQRPQGQWTIDDVEGGAYFSQVMALYTKARHYNITAGIPAFAIHYYRSEDSRKGSTTTDGGGGIFFSSSRQPDTAVPRTAPASAANTNDDFMRDPFFA